MLISEFVERSLYSNCAIRFEFIHRKDSRLFSGDFDDIKNGFLEKSQRVKTSFSARGVKGRAVVVASRARNSSGCCCSFHVCE